MDDLKRQTIRTLEAVAALRVHLDGDGAADVHDIVASLMDCMWGRVPDSAQLVAWTLQAQSVLQAATNGHSTPDAVRAMVHVLRLRQTAQRLVPAPKQTKPARIEPIEVKPPAPPRELTENEKAILAYLRTHPGERTRDILTGLAGSMSDRTVKRSLAELLKLNRIKRIERDDASVVYEVAA